MDPGRNSPWPPWFEARLPSPQECSPPWHLRERAQRDPEGVFVVLEDGTAWSNHSMRSRVLETAGRLMSVGLAREDRLVLWLPNGPDILRYLFASWLLGLTPVPINVASRGGPLVNALSLADARVLILHPGLVARLNELPPECTGQFTSVIVPNLTGAAATVRGAAMRAEATIPAQSIDAHADSARHPWEIAAIIFSSGTTGISKGVITPFGQLWSLGRAFYGLLRSDDRMLLMYPLFHVAALSAVFGTLATGGSFALTESFRAAEFLDVARRTGATTAPGLGRTLVDAVNKRPPLPDDAVNPLRIINVQSITPAVLEFAERFACAVIPSYSMTETSGIAIGLPSDTKLGTIGRPRSGIEVRLVDEHDLPVPLGQPGEVIVRSDHPWVLNSGYFRNPLATAQAWRNGWFHTGDIARQDAEGDLYFIDRSGDVIRRRSENISSSEIEAEARQFPQVQDAAAIGVETPEGEEVLLVVVPTPGMTIEPIEMLGFMIKRLPHYMVPRYLRILAELPKTQTNRVQKSELRREGLTADSWDRLSAGIEVKRERL